MALSLFNSIVPAQRNTQQILLNRLIWLMIFAATAIDVVWGAQAGIMLDLKTSGNIGFVLLVVSLMAALCYYYSHVRQEYGIGLMLQMTLQAICFSFAAAALSYISATWNRPLYDDVFIALDGLAQFHWKAYVASIHASPLLTRLCTLGYVSMGPQFVGIMVLLFLLQRYDRLQHMFLATEIGIIAAILLSAVFPAVGGYVHYNILSTDYSAFMPAAARIHESDLLGLRSGQLHILPQNFQGLITFPSCHALLAVMFIYATWPLVKLRCFFIPLNIVLLLSTPVDGGHYLVDVLAGCIIAAGAIGLVHVIAARVAWTMRVYS